VEPDLNARLTYAGETRQCGNLAPTASPVAHIIGDPSRGARIASVPGAQLEDFGSGLTPVTPGWFVVNVRDAEWWSTEGRGARCAFENEYGDSPVEFAQLGINLTVLEPGQTGLYLAESNQEAFLVLSGECALIVENEERRLRPWDFFRCALWTEHAFVGAGEAPCVILMAGPRSGPGVRYPVCRSSPRATARAWRRRPPTGGRRTRPSSASVENGRRAVRACPGRRERGVPALSSDLLGEPDQESLRPSDVAEPIHVLVLDHVSDELRASLAEPGKRAVDVVHLEHDAEVAQSVHRSVPVVRDRRRGEKPRELEPAVAVGRPHHGDLDALVAQSRDASGPLAFDHGLPLEFEAELAKELDRRR
jgi:quercetin dioxygenase-like cupin family protein